MRQSFFLIGNSVGKDVTLFKIQYLLICVI